MLVLGIETSCDETSVAVVRDGVQVMSNVISSSRKSFEHLAGVIPEQAARHQIECMMPVLNEALLQAKITMKDIDAIAVTRGPGLLGSLLVGTVTARAIASIHKKPLIGVHHTLGHLSSTWLEGGLPICPSEKGAPILGRESIADAPQPGMAAPLFPVLTLSASGGHTDLWLRTSHIRGQLLGRTRDDAAGEAFDKGASMLGLPYPGGPSISKTAEGGNISAHDFPLPLRNENTLDFSFSGLKTSLKYLLHDLQLTISPSAHSPIRPSDLTDIAASFEHAICRHLTDRIERALKKYPDVKEVHLVGGVSANTHLRKLAAVIRPFDHLTIRAPKTLAFCTDNAAMIAAAGFFLAQEIGEDAYKKFETEASVPLAECIRTDRHIA